MSYPAGKMPAYCSQGVQKRGLEKSVALHSQVVPAYSLQRLEYSAVKSWANWDETHYEGGGLLETVRTWLG